MSEKIEKIAKRSRKPSSDPAQEKLRQAKDTWNEKASTIISGLIALKRGLNGRGDPKAGLPPSSIKEPLPPQIGQYLSEMSNKFLSLVDDAKGIVDEQTQYSAHRRKPKLKMKNISAPANETIPLAASAERGLIVEASWWGSRAWARISLLRKVDKLNRRLRLNLLDSFVEVGEDLKKFEGILLEYKNHDSVPSAITELSSLTTEYVSALRINLDKLEDIYKILKEQKHKKSEVSLKDTKPTTPSIEDPGARFPTEAPSSIATDVWEAYKKVYIQLTKIGVVVNAIVRMDNVDKSNAKTLENIYNKFVREIVVFNDLTHRSDHDKTVIELETMAKDIISKYNELLKLSTSILGQAQDFNELVQKITVKISSYLEISNSQEELHKLATGAVSRWLNKVWMSINPDNIARMKLELVRLSVETRKLLELAMNSLEDRESDSDVIALRISKVSQEMLELINLSIGISKLYMIDTRRQPKDRKLRQATEIKLSDINVLKNIGKELSDYVVNKKDDGQN